MSGDNVMSPLNYVSAALQPSFATVPAIKDVYRVPYPDGVQRPNARFNADVKDSRFIYDRDFLLQFKSICKEEPLMPTSLKFLHINYSKQTHPPITRGQSGRRSISKMLSPNHSQTPAIWNGGTFGKTKTPNPFSMNFATHGTSGITPPERFTISSDKWVLSSGSSNPADMPSGRSPRQSTSGERALTELGGDDIGNQVPRDLRRKRSHDSEGPQGQMEYEDIALHTVTNRWIASSTSGKWQDIDTPEAIDRKVKGLLNKLHPANFDSISDQLIACANKSENENDDRSMIRVIRQVFEKAVDEEMWSETYGRLCRKIMKQISPKVKDDGIRNAKGKPISGGQLFRKYLLGRCQEGFEGGLGRKNAVSVAATAKDDEHEAAKQATSRHADNADCQPVLSSDEFHAIQKARRQRLGLIRFLGELFKLHMVTERIMHECIKKLLGKVEIPEAEEIESLCKLLTTVGHILDTNKARAHMDVHFSRMKELARSGIVNPRLQLLLVDVIELRERRWIPRTSHADARRKNDPQGRQANCSGKGHNVSYTKR